jgi:hypothetical protein
MSAFGGKADILEKSSPMCGYDPLRSSYSLTVAASACSINSVARQGRPTKLLIERGLRDHPAWRFLLRGNNASADIRADIR